MPPLQPLAAAAPATTAQRVSLVGQPLRPQHQPQQTARHASPPPSLRAAMLAHSAAADRLTYLAGLLLNATAVFHSPLSERDRWVLSALTASLALMCVLTLAAPRHYLSVRPWLSALMRFVNAGLLPFVMDGLSVTRHDDERGWGTMARAAVVLLLPVTLLHVQYLASLGTPQPPLLHLAMQGASVALLMWRAPAVCRRYVAMHPSYERMASLAYGALQQGTSLACPGTRLTLQAAAEAAAPWQKCEAVVWALEVPLGFVLPTLLAWRAQLRAARANAAEWRGRGPQDAAAAAEAELQSSEYERVCAPALKAAAYWGWPITLALAGLAGFIAALLRFDPDAQ
ncbi:hypothetical protein COHA_010392 [Chlorella ohadii]|uniref:Uncharacterized protein n=1 Tax=Chlorella ohadii TaxID=2649997 RepID=A0AAD5DCY3_9CHLO|nr:hypothetical protein COHA_010392 [Chlorella ohadii]